MTAQVHYSHNPAGKIYLLLKGNENIPNSPRRAELVTVISPENEEN